MNAFEFQQFIYNQIPITKYMDINILEFTPSTVRIGASLEANKNHKSTAFGGSINSLMTLCGWAMAFINIKQVDPDCHIVIQKSTINFLLPIKDNFAAECKIDDGNSIDKFIDTFKKHGKSRIKLIVKCYENEKLSAEFEGQYVVFK